MSLKNNKQEFADKTASAFKELYGEVYKSLGDEQIFNSDFILDNIEKPKDPSMGRFAFPVFRYGKLLKDNPAKIASKVVKHLESLEESLSFTVSAAGGFINVKTDFVAEAKMVIADLLLKPDSYGSSEIGKGKKMLVEYSAPNIAKPFGVGHLRTTILGNSLRRIFKKLGYETTGVNYLGDWGTQFGKMIVAYKKWADDKIKGQETVGDLLELYIKFHDLAETDSELEDEARVEFHKLEAGDEENTKLWERFRQISLDEFIRVYNLMGIEFDWITGEAYLNDKMDATQDRLEKAGLVSISQGATIVDLDDEQLPPALLKKADGATLYLTRDITGFLYRYEKYKFDEMIYVVATNQSVHFQQLFKVIQMMDEAESNDGLSQKGKHIEFGMIKFGDQIMSTRKGNIVFLEDVIMKAADLAKEKINEKNPDLVGIDETSLMIGLGAVFFSQLSVRRHKEVNFNWEQVLSFEGETGPYLQYTHARLCSLIRNYKQEINSEIDFTLLDAPEEQRLVELLADYGLAVEDAGRLYDPNLIAVYLIRLAGSFNKLYQRKDEQGRIDKIISDDNALSAARIALVKAVQVVIKDGLYLLGIQAPKEM